MIAPEHQNLTLQDFCNSNSDVKFDRLNINKPIGALTLADLNWCLRKRQFLDPVVAIVLDKIEENQLEINQYFTTEICEWYDEAIKEIITIPFTFWDNKHVIFYKYCALITEFSKRQLPLEKTQIELFLTYKPSSVCWTKANGENFVDYFNHELLGNFLEAQQIITDLKYALLNGQGIFIESEFTEINTVEQLLSFVREEYGDLDENFGANGYWLTEIIENIEDVKVIKFIPKE